jgi:hypothetical protein
VHLSSPSTYYSAYAACGLLFVIAPPAGVLLSLVVTANLVDEWRTEQRAAASRARWERMLEVSDNFGWGPILRYGDDRYGGGGEPKQFYACRCHKQMGNDFWFLPKGQCLYGKCNDPI